VTFEMVIRRESTGRNITLVFNPGETSEDTLLNNADTGVTRYVNKTATGAESYSFVLTSNVTGWVATLNAMAVNVTRENTPPPILPAVVTLSNLTRTVDGTPKSPDVSTDPAGLAVALTFNGSATAPDTSGVYEVVAVVTENGYEGSTTATFTLLTEEGFVDSNGNVVDDTWEMNTLGNLNHDPVVINGESYSRRVVYVWGLESPLTQVFAMNGMTFPTVPNRHYQIQFRSSLLVGEWQNLGESFPGDGEGHTLQNPGPGFYRVEVLLP
jgi:hypothetical protein